jgi:transposase-like protein
MDLSRAVYSRDLKIAAMRALDAGARTGEIARKYQLSPQLLERWRGEWRAKGESASWSARLASSRWRRIF